MRQRNPYPLRLDESVEKKIKTLAKLNDRSFRAQIENILKNYIATYEQENGEIVIEKEKP